MEALTDYITKLPELLGVFLLMLSTFLIGYFSATQLQRNKFRIIIERLKREVNALKTISPKKETRDIQTIFSEIKPQIIKVVKEQQEKLAEEELLFETEKQAIAKRAKNTFITSKEAGPVDDTDDEDTELDFDSFGYADFTDKEDLTVINGIGPYTEQKLNDIGIYTYEQISKLSKRDIELITEMIDFFPGRIERDNWVGQAKSLIVY